MINGMTPMEIVRWHERKAPVPVSQIARDLGLRVWQATWDTDVSGMIRKDKKYGGKSGYAILVNRAHPKTRRRFTIAHEVAHFLLHRELIGDGITDDALYRSEIGSSIEAQANRFAASVLMPWPLVREAVQSGVDTVPELAKRFAVSNSAMSIRLGIPFENR